jgi:hypothetical protein
VVDEVVCGNCCSNDDDQGDKALELAVAASTRELLQ